MDLDWLKDFSALAELKSFSRAADARNVTQPAFSRRIRALEDWIGTPLFLRGAQGASLTRAGIHFQPLAADMIRNLERARRDTRSVGERNTVTLSMAATSRAFIHVLPRMDPEPPSLRGAGSPQSNFGKHGSLRADHAQRGSPLPAVPLPSGGADPLRA
jgi:DNA-binding transcriptional LysR family regulator